MNSRPNKSADEATMLARALSAPASTVQLSEADWDLLIRQGRRANLLARLAALLDDGQLIENLPAGARHHLISAQRAARRQDMATRVEIKCIQAALASVQAPIILLKGAAYLMAGLPPAKGRQFSDVDILVPKNIIGEVESQLMIHGWQGTGQTAYDQRYYREWMHEIPPLRHIQRGAVIDVHHSILPETARIKVNTAALWQSPVNLPGCDRLFVLAPADMVLHSATHLFHEGEFHNGLRDLVDLDSLLRHFGETTGFWDSIVPRARELGLERPLYYALRHAKSILGTPIPKEVIDGVATPRWPIRSVMDFCYRRTLRPDHASCADAWTPLAQFALYVRSHWMRMPFFLLAYHLMRKALVTETPHSREPDEPPGHDRPAG